MKVLVLGNSASRWQKEFIRNVFLPLGHVVYVFATREKNQYEEFYKEQGVHYVESKPIPSFIMRIPKVRAEVMLHNQVRALKRCSPYDVIINMFVSTSGLRCANALKSENTKTFAYFCGSDILRAEGYKLKSLKLGLKSVDRVFLASGQVERGYQEKIEGMSCGCAKVIHLGISVFDEIDKIRTQNRDAKNELGIDNDLTSICIGYNANEAQQHLYIIQQLALLPEDQKKNIILLAPMTYGRKEQYVNQVKQALEASGLEYRTFESFMDDGQMALLHCATDIFINAQTTDGLSASVLESMYSESVLISATWLHYPEFQEWDLSYIPFDGFERLCSIITQIVNGKKTCDTRKNQRILKEKMSWKMTRELWDNSLRN